MLSRFSICICLTSTVLCALDVNINNPASIKQAASLVAQDMLSLYHGNKPGQVPGILPGPPPDGPYYWWIGGAMWGALLDYRLYTGDKSFDDTIMQALTFQVGENRDYMPGNWTASMGNDDQSFWAFSAMTAAETRFAAPPKKTGLDWLALAQAVFNEQGEPERRVHADGKNPVGVCQGGLRWQVFNFNVGFDYVNTIANACYFNMGARLARYTGNATYAELAEKTWDWLEHAGYVDEGKVFDGGHVGSQCKDVNQLRFSYNAAILSQGVAFLYAQTEGSQQAVWKSRLDVLLNATLVSFFPNGIATEIACENDNSCTVDMKSFKGYLHRWLASTALLAPYTADKIFPVLRTSTKAAVARCTGGSNGRMCAFKWPLDAVDQTNQESQVVQQMSVLGALTSLLATPASAPVTNSTGGTAKGDPHAGHALPKPKAEITASDRIFAGVVTTVLIAGGLAVFVWMGFR